MAQQTLVRQSLLILEASRSHSDAPHSVGIILTIDQPVSEVFTWQHTTLTTDRSLPDNTQHSQQTGLYLTTHNTHNRQAFTWQHTKLTTDRPLPDNTQHSQQTGIDAPEGIRTCNPKKGATADPRLRQRGHWDRLWLMLQNRAWDFLNVPLNLVILLDDSGVPKGGGEFGVQTPPPKFRNFDKSEPKQS
jgi:hypothetical protein